MKYHFYNSEVIDIIEVTPLVRRYFFRIPEVNDFKFNPGQFIMLDLPIASKITTRAYSIASPPDGTNVIELLISLNPEGLGTPYLFNEIKVGSRLPLSQPAGKFMQPGTPVGEMAICLICTGTGIAPFRSLLLDLKKKNFSNFHIDLIFGSRYEKDIIYRKEFEDLALTMPGFTYTTVLSREAGSAWSGRKGYVHNAYRDLYSDKRPAMFYLCGWKVMIKETRDNLQLMGYDKKQIKFELYD